MKLTTLISMTDFVLKLKANRTICLSSVSDTNWKDIAQVAQLMNKRCIAYADFLSMDLELGMFIPCNNWNEPIKEPDLDTLIDENAYKGLMKDYKQAKDKCLFKITPNIYSDDFYEDVIKGFKTVEGLLLMDKELFGKLELTQTTINQLKL